MDAKDRAIDINEKLQAADAAHPGSPELAALHETLKDGLEEQAEALGFDSDDLADIENAGTAARAAFGGEPKE